MSVVALFSIIAGALLFLAGVAVILKYVSAPQRATRSEHRQLKELQALVNRIDNLAYNSREINPELSVQVIDEIRNYKQKELNS